MYPRGLPEIPKETTAPKKLRLAEQTQLFHFTKLETKRVSESVVAKVNGEARFSGVLNLLYLKKATTFSNLASLLAPPPEDSTPPHGTALWPLLRQEIWMRVWCAVRSTGQMNLSDLKQWLTMVGCFPGTTDFKYSKEPMNHGLEKFQFHNEIASLRYHQGPTLQWSTGL